jgi:hypothetical protein
MAVQEIRFVKPCLGELFLYLESKSVTFIRCQFISPKKYTQGFQGEALSRSIRIVIGVPYGLLYMIIYLAVELCAAQETFINCVVVLVGLDMRED